MKKLTTLLLLSFLFFVAVGQRAIFDSMPKQSRSSFLGDSAHVYTGTQIWSTGLPETKTDTVMVLMMVTDTSRSAVIDELLKPLYNAGSTFITIDADSTYLDTVYNEPDLSVKAMIGYAVRKKETINLYTSYDFHIITKYLDDKKQPLSKNIIVWQSVNQK